MASFSTALLEAMGFREAFKEGGLSASFMSITVYEARGIALPEGFAEAHQARVAGTTYRVALSKSVNTGCQRLVGDEFCEVESEWLEKVKASGPFVLVAVGPTDFIRSGAGRLMRMPDGAINTYDSFPAVREMTRLLEDRVLPPVVASLTFALSEPDRHVELRKLDRACVGRMQDGTVVHDTRLVAHAELTVSRNLEAARAKGMLATAVTRAPELQQKAARYVALGLAEKDELKRFLFYFLALEVETHAVFRRIDNPKAVRNCVVQEAVNAPRRAAIDLIIRDLSNWTNLADRFIWCATCVWTGLDDADIELFKQLKETRDAIAHGRISEPPQGSAQRAERLVHKVIWIHAKSKLETRQIAEG